MLLQTVVETSEFIRQSEKYMDEKSKQQFIFYIAANPFAGDIISGAGGVRKIRWAKDQHNGKRSGVRIIYYHHNATIPIFLFTLYAKNQKENLTKSECNILQKIVKQIAISYEQSIYE